MKGKHKGRTIDPKLEEKTLSGELYDSLSKEIMDFQEERKRLVRAYNLTPLTKRGFRKRARLLKEIFPENGDTAFIEPPFHANWGGYHVRLGKNFYANFNLTLVDDGLIEIGDDVMFGPNVTLITAAHPIHEDIRKDGVQFNEPIHIGNHVWLGANVTVLPGVSIGEGSVIGANSLVTKDVPAHSLCYGSPAKVIRVIGEQDLVYYRKNKKIPDEFQKK